MAAIGAPVLAVVLAVSAAVLDKAFPPDLPPPAVSPVVLDRNGALLRAFTVDDGRWRLPLTLAEVDPDFTKLLIAYEDQRFHEHAGVDPLAVVRAAGEAVLAGRIVSGASTITMQTVRLTSGERSRNPVRKIVEMARAIQVERRLDKDEILTRYLHLAPYGGNIEGIRAASLAYFGREPARLTLAQIALLIALPQSPEARRPDRHPERARAARTRVLAELAARGAITSAEATDADREDMPTARRPVPRLAPHVARRLVSAAP
ncbi:MAG: transglycosylase domain-containing protein, partial [Pseudomonadota bacterium]